MTSDRPSNREPAADDSPSGPAGGRAMPAGTVVPGDGGEAALPAIGPADSTLAPPGSPSATSDLNEPEARAEAPPADTSAADLTSADDAEVEPAGASVLAEADEPVQHDELEELTLPSLVQPPPVLAPGTALGPDRRLTVGEHLGARGRVNRYAATWQDEIGQDIEVELREGPTDHAGLRREAEILAGLQYAMLPHAYLAWEQDDRRYLALDRLDGETLAEQLQAGLPADQAISLILQLVQVVRRLHRAGWALLGLTPADVYPGQPLRIGQLGHAARIGEVPSQALQLAGYSAPELAHPEAITGQEDVYALGALLYQALAGHPPPEGGLDLAELSSAVRVPGIPQLLADALAPADERLDLEELYRRLLALRSHQTEQPLTLEVASATTVGLNPTRPVNEDSCAYATWLVAGADGVVYRALLCVADGMGGMEAGEIASQTAVGVVMQGAAALVPDASPGAGDAAPPAAAPAPLDPVALVRRAATAVHGAARGRELGTTMTCLTVQGGELTLGHVGDTRAYLLRAGELSQLTADHSLVAAMVASGVIAKEEARGHPDSNKVLRSLGSQRELPDGYVDDLRATLEQPTLRLEPGDWLLLCTDGVWGTVEDAEIRVILTEALDCPTAARALIDRALRAGAPDNATTVVARCVAMPAL